MISIVVYIPASHLQQVKQAMFNAGAGTIDNYQECCWQVAGQGQFRPMQGSSAFIGETDKLSTVKEYRVEMICKKDNVNDVIKALKASHPYETPAYFYFTVFTD
ncbi:Bsu YqfO NIF3/CutA domain [hydrothermal vent metagenome]|uniref:Bsu YqfO NIF3/CutA domain n=1 Tax=hydrothermal vent metagenome TaxID=652676 RepID=A0A3B0URD3_9ZZZZ